MPMRVLHRGLGVTPFPEACPPPGAPTAEGCCRGSLLVHGFGEGAGRRDGPATTDAPSPAWWLPERDA